MKLKIKYPKFLLLLLTFVLAYFIFAGRNFDAFQNALSSLGYFGTFLAGIMFAYGFTAAPAAAVFLIIAKTQNIFIAAIIGGIGALLGDYIIFRIIRFSFKDEILKLEKDMAKNKVIKDLENHISTKIKHAFIMIIADVIIASPLPDEIGVAMISLDRKISRGIFASLSFLLNTIGILIILLIGNSI